MNAVTFLFVTLMLVWRVRGQNQAMKQLAGLKNVVTALSRQLMLQQLAAEEATRSNGGSGIKQIRVGRSGPRSYFSNSHSGTAMAAIHDHANSRRLLGQGEAEFVLNGVHFRTRHNDYPLNMASRKSSGYNVVQNVPFPDVPPDVLQKTSVQGQVDEMREWVKAWRDQDHSQRDYRKYFKPVLCYLEGAWTTVKEAVEEPFFSDRHALEAETWFDLQEKIRFTAYTGRKNLEENYAYLPTTIINITSAGMPVYAQWNYRILCHPLSVDVPTSYLRLVDDLGVRLRGKQTLNKYKKSRAARFTVQSPKETRASKWQQLDIMMAEIPGRDNYLANITDTAFGVTFYHPDTSSNQTMLNVGFYNRRYKIRKPDAMGLNYGQRGFSDPNLFVAETTQRRVAPIYVRQCKKRVCYESLKRMTYAIPLEIVYLTPLQTWNPYELPFRERAQKQVVTGNGKRKGGFTLESAYNGTMHNLYYRTPSEFFTGGEVGVDPADTAKNSVGVLDPSGAVRRVSSSGTRIFLPKIPGVGILRQRYPIMPVHGEASPVWKELNALKDIVLKLASNEMYLYEKPAWKNTGPNANIKPNIGKPQARRPSKKPRSQLVPDASPYLTLTLSTATRIPPGEHTHTVEFSREERDALRAGQTVSTITSENNGHSHDVLVKFYKGRFHVSSCDGGPLPCWDGHTHCLTWATENSCPLSDDVPPTNSTVTPVPFKVSQPIPGQPLPSAPLGTTLSGNLGGSRDSGNTERPTARQGIFAFLGGRSRLNLSELFSQGLQIPRIPQP